MRFRTSSLRLVLLLVAIAPLPPAAGQSQFAEVCRQEINRAAPDSPAQLLAMFKLTDALQSQNLKLAFQNSEAALKSASQLGDPDFITIAKVDRLLIQDLRGLQPDPELAATDPSFAEWKLTENALSELRFHLFSALIEHGLWSGNTDVDFRPLLDSLQNATNGCRDPHLLFRQKVLDIYVRVFRLGESTLDQQDVVKRELIRLESQSLPFLEGVILTFLLDSEVAKQEKRFEERVELLGKALTAAEDSNHLFFIFRCNQIIAACKQQSREFESSLFHSKAALNAAEKLEAQTLIYQALVHLAAVENRMGNPKQAATYLQRADHSRDLAKLPIFQTDRLYQLAMWTHAQLGDQPRVIAYRQQIIPKPAVDKIRTQQKELEARESESESRRQQIHQVTKNAANEKQSQLQAVARVEDSIRFFKKYSALSTLLVFLLFPWFILLLVRGRLRKVSGELDTERVASQETQVKFDDLTTRLNRLQRMESLGLMAGSVAHDFNNILVGVMGNAEIIQMKNKSGDQSLSNDFVNQRIGSIIKSAEKAASLSRQMLAYAGKQSIAKRTTDLNQLIRQYESVLRSACREGQELILELGQDKIVSKVDITQVEQVLLNLVTNAVQASAGPGRITIRTGIQLIDNVETDFLLFGIRKTGGEFCYIEVADTGQGISGQALERIFEPFYTNAEMGRGLGLSVVYGVVTGHDGFIKCDSTVGKGTTFRILIPLSNAPLESLNLAEELPSGSPETFDLTRTHSNHKVLVIDDEETVLDLCSQLIELNGWSVITALGGKAGLQLAEEFADEISCILTDVVMPEMGANELLREFEKRDLRMPIVLMSGFSQTRLDFFLEQTNVVSIIQKPFRAEQLQAAVHQAIGLKNGMIGRDATRESTTSSEHSQ